MLKRVSATLLNFKFDEKLGSNICQLEFVSVDERDIENGRLGDHRSVETIRKNCYNHDWRNQGNLSNCVAKSTDFACAYPDCAYHHALETKVVLHVRSHFTFEVSSDIGEKTEMCFSKGRYKCSACPRATADKICFREHLRHHLFQWPYSCPNCSLAVKSVNEMRKHFQSDHGKQQVDLKFCLSAHSSLLNELVELLGPGVDPLREPLKLFVPDSSYVDQATERRLTQLTSNLFDKHIERQPRQDTISRSISTVCSSGGERDQAAESPRSLRGMSFSNCSFKTENIAAFRSHAWKHIHNSWGSDCQHRGHVKTSNDDCTVVNGLLKILSVIDHVKKTNEGW
jgi:hypothetical protein